MNTALEKLLISELRIVVYEAADAGSKPAKADSFVPQLLSDDRITQAMTVNEELRNLGYTLKPADILRLAASRSMTGFAQHFRSLMPSVDAPPMYPDFPEQVMKMEEAEFRMHQMIHYFSTYGLEDLFGVEISRGWLPDVRATEKSRSDDPLLEAKVLELMPEEEAPFEALRRILARRERMTKPSKELVKLSVPLVTPQQLSGIQIPFKENLVELFDAVLEGTDGTDRIQFLRQICQHTGDVMKCVYGILPKHRYHLKTGQKRAIVKLLESYPEQDFKANLILSREGREKNLVSLQYLDYNMYSRSDVHREAVRALRNGELRSWEAQARYLVENGDQGALDFIAARPGMMLRMIRWLLRKGYKDSDILKLLRSKSDALSLHTIVDTLNALDEARMREPLEDLYKASLDRREAEAAMRRENLKKMLSKERNLDPELRDHIIRNAEHRQSRSIESFSLEYRKARALYEKSQPYDGRVCDILTAVLFEHLKGMRTELYQKKVYLQTDAYDLSRSVLKSGNGSEEGGYLPAGIAIRIPDEVRHLRFFVYWNDKKRVDLDLHAEAYNTEFEPIHVGWDADFKKDGIVHSGDITHSNAAEYIDIDLDAPLLRVQTRIHIYYGKESFKKIDTCYVGMMAVKKLGAKVKLYDPQNCFFTHELRSDTDELQYGYVDVPGRRLYFVGKQPEILPEYYRPFETTQQNCSGGCRMTMDRYLSMLLEAQEVTAAASPEEADIILTVGKSAEEKGVSLVDRNFYLEE